jgi:hypothetical protein
VTTDAFSFFVPAARNAVRHPEGWEVHPLDRHRIEYRDGDDVARIGIEDLAGGVALYARTVEWVTRSTSDTAESTDVLARCALALQAMAWGDVRVDWGTPRWGTTGNDEAYSFVGRCVVRLLRDGHVAEYEDADTRTTVALERTNVGECEGTAWMLRRDGRLPADILDRIVDGILHLTGEPVQVRQGE